MLVHTSAIQTIVQRDVLDRRHLSMIIWRITTGAAANVRGMADVFVIFGNIKNTLGVLVVDNEGKFNLGMERAFILNHREDIAVSTTLVKIPKWTDAENLYRSTASWSRTTRNNGHVESWN